MTSAQSAYLEITLTALIEILGWLISAPVKAMPRTENR